MYKKILVITNSFDLTSDYLTNTDKHVQFVKVNADKFSDYSFLVREDGVKIKTLSGEFYLQEFFSTYYRKPSLPQIDGIVAGESQVITQKEIFFPLESVAESFSENSLSISSPGRKPNNNRIQSLKPEPIRFNEPPNRITKLKDWTQSTYLNESMAKSVSQGTEKPDIIIQKNFAIKKLAIKFMIAVVLALLASLPTTIVVLLRLGNMEPQEYTILSLLDNYKYLYIFLTSISFFVVFRVFSSFKK